MRRGFSLVELSIVLVILGLLTGGILAGQSLIRAAEIRSVSTDFTRYQTAIFTFRDKYMALPGDFRKATDFWLIRGGDGSNVACHQTLNTPAGTCNGDGNGRIDMITGDASNGERFSSWQHMAYAGLIEGSFTGASTSATAEGRSTGINIPKLKIGSTTGMVLAYVAGPQTISTEYFNGPYSTNALHMSGGGAQLKPEEAWNIDTKMDDGKPGTGSMFVYKASGTWGPGCADGDTTAANYAVSDTTLRCNLNLLLR